MPDTSVPPADTPDASGHPAPAADTAAPVSFDSFGLAPEILKAVLEQGYTTPTPIQAQAIPVVLSGRDVMGAAQTGTGKTASFSLPILQRLLPLASNSASPARHPIRALILTPTRELADQVAANVFRLRQAHPLAQRCRVRRRRHESAVGGLASWGRDPDCDPGPAARSRPAEDGESGPGPDARARRSRPDARHGLFCPTSSAS